MNDTPPTSPTLAPIQWYLRWAIVIGALSAAALMVVLAKVQVGSEHTTRTVFRILLTLIGLVVGGGLADMQLGALPHHRRWVAAGLIAIGLSQTCFHILVWTAWVVEHPVWRAWWLTMCASVSITHLLVLRRAAVGKNDWIERGAPWCALATAAFVAGLAVHVRLPAQPYLIYWILLAVPAIAVTLGTLVVTARWIVAAAKNAEPLSRPHFRTLLVVSHVGLLGMGIYLGRLGASQVGRFEGFPSALAGLSPEQLDAQITTDLKRLKVASEGLDRLAQEFKTLDEELRHKIADIREYYLPEEKELIHRKFATYLHHRTVLLRIIVTYVGFHAVRDPLRQDRCFMLAIAAGSRLLCASLVLTDTYGDDKMACRILNEPVPGAAIPEGMFDQIYEGITTQANFDKFDEMVRYFRRKQESWHKRGQEIWPDEVFGRLEDRIDASIQAVAEKRPPEFRRLVMRAEVIARKIKRQAYELPVYEAQSFAATLIGDMHVVEQAPLITVEDIKNKIRPHLQPGDLLLERRNWYMSNAFLPGFWPHAALYLGSGDDLKKLGVLDDPDVRLHLIDHESEDGYAGATHTVIESVSEGVIFNTLEHSMHADFVAVLRPRKLTQQQISRAIKRAFRHHHKPYDFSFDFASADKLVCTELVYRAYQGMLNFQDPKTGLLPKVMGRYTLPADQIVRKFKREFGSEGAELQLVLFVDWDPEKQQSVYWYGEKPESVRQFVETLERPGAFNE